MADMHDPAHLGEIIREALDTEGWTGRQAAERLGVARVTLQRILNRRAGVSPRMALALEAIGWTTRRSGGAHEASRDEDSTSWTVSKTTPLPDSRTCREVTNGPSFICTFGPFRPDRHGRCGG